MKTTFAYSLVGGFKSLLLWSWLLLSSSSEEVGVCSFVIPWAAAPVASPSRRSSTTTRSNSAYHRSTSNKLFTSREEQQQQQQQLTVQLSLPETTDNNDEKITALFAWVSRAFAGDARYGNLMLALAAIYGDLPKDSPPVQMLADALSLLRQQSDHEDKVCGAPYSLQERERASLGAMGAAQWTGQSWWTRPHALLSVQNLTSVDQWTKTLPRGCRRTLKKSAAAQNFTVTAHPIRNDAPAPHSSLAHFRCVVEHEVRLLASSALDSSSPEDFFDALAEAVGRYVGTTRMAGEIREYRDTETGRIIAFAHEVRKGRTIRGQWFYATNEASKKYVWFHSVHSLVQRAIEAEGVDVVDLGPSGSDDFSELKSRYGFVSVEDWPAVADYRGPFWDYDKGEATRNGVSI